MQNIGHETSITVPIQPFILLVSYKHILPALLEQIRAES